MHSSCHIHNVLHNLVLWLKSNSNKTMEKYLHTFIVDVTAPILRVVPFFRTKTDVHFHQEFVNLHYVSMAKSFIDQVHVSIKGDTGEDIPFVTGKTLFKLHSRERKNGNPISCYRGLERQYELRHEKTMSFSHMRTTKVQISLRIRAVCSAPLLFAA